MYKHISYICDFVYVMNIYVYMFVYVDTYLYIFMHEKFFTERIRTKTVRLPDVNSNMESYHFLFHFTHLPQAVQQYLLYIERWTERSERTLSCFTCHT